MINANELRIGNWIQHEPYPDELWQVDFKLLESIDLQLVECVGIPLTPDILVKCGFSTDEMKVEYRLGLPIGNGSDLFIEDEGHLSKSCGIKTDDTQHKGKTMPGHFNYFADIKYLHQLQNLCFALTKKELPIEL